MLVKIVAECRILSCRRYM